MATIRRLLLVVEGPHDALCIERALPQSLTINVEIVPAGGLQGVMHLCRTLLGSARPVLGVRDRDLMTQDEVDAVLKRTPNLFIWPGRCLENEFLHVPLLVSTSRATGGELDEPTVREELRRIAEKHRDQIIATLVDRRLRELVPDEPGEPIKARLPPGVDPGAPLTPNVRLQVQLQDRVNIAQNRLRQYSATYNAIEKQLAERFDIDHLELMDGKRAFGELGPELNPFRNSERFEALLLRRIQEGETPPGFAALRQRVNELAANYFPRNK